MKKLYKGLASAFSMFTIIPMPHFEWEDENIRYMLIFLPVVGLVIGLLWVMGIQLAQVLSINTMLKSFLIMIIPFGLTGFLHADGFCDTCDAVFSGRDLEKKLKILKDPTVGVFGACGLIIMFIFNFSSAYDYENINSSAGILLLLPIVSRCIASSGLILLKPLKGSSLGALFKMHCQRDDIYILIGFLFLSLSAAYYFNGIGGIIILVIAACCAILAGLYSYKHLDGFSGDVSGFVIVICESAGLLLMSCGIGVAF